MVNPPALHRIALPGTGPAGEDKEMGPMKQRWLLGITLVTILFGGVALTQPSSQAHSKRNAGVSRTGANAQSRDFDPLAGSAGLRWRLGQPSHWRSMLLQR